MTWCNAGDKAWAYGKKHIHEMPTFRKYEYSRTDFLAQCYVTMRQDIRVSDFFKSAEGKQYVNAELKRVLERRDDIEREWTESTQSFRKFAGSVDEMVEGVEEMIKAAGGLNNIPWEQWWRFIVPLSEIDNPEKLRVGRAVEKTGVTSSS